MVTMGSLQGKSKCTSTSDEAAANPQPHSHHMNLCIGPTLPGAGKCEILSLKVHIFLHRLIENFFYPKKRHLCQTASAQLSSRCTGFGHEDGLGHHAPHAESEPGQKILFLTWTSPEFPVCWRGSVYFRVLAKISLLFGNNSSWNPLFYPIFFFFGLWCESVMNTVCIRWWYAKFCTCKKLFLQLNQTIRCFVTVYHCLV